MIDKEHFIKRIAEASHLTGYPVRREIGQLMWERLKNNNVGDFNEAVEELIETDERINYRTVRDLINKYLSLRMDNEEKIRTRRILSERENKKFWWDEKQEERACDHKCSQCEQYECGKVANAAMDGIKAVLSRQKTIVQLHEELAAQFPGIGFEAEIPGREAF